MGVVDELSSLWSAVKKPMTSDDVFAALVFVPGDLVLIKHNLRPSKSHGIGLVVAVSYDFEGSADVLWRAGDGPFLRGHAFDQLFHLTS